MINKSPGPDNISANILRNCAGSLSVPLVALMKQSLECDDFPPEWKTAVARPIFKKGEKFDKR